MRGSQDQTVPRALQPHWRNRPHRAGLFILYGPGPTFSSGVM